MDNQHRGRGLDRRHFLAAAGAAVVAGGSFASSPALAHAGTAGRAGARTTAPASAPTTALTHVTVIDVVHGRTRRDQTVLLRGGRITAVGRDVRIPRDATVVDLAGKYVIPGLADLHVHSIGGERIAPPLYVANGVTTVREMAGNPMVYDWRDRIEAGSLLGPRMVVAGRIIDGDPTLWDPALLPVLVVQDEASARAAVRQVKSEGADFVKVYSRLSPAAYRAILDEARRLRLTVAGHCPDTVPVAAASAAGQRSIEHLHAVALSVSSREAEVRRRLLAIKVGTGDYNGWFRQYHPIEWLAANTYSQARAAEVFGRLAHHRTRITPTLVMHRVLDMPDHTRPDPATRKYLTADDAGTYDWVLENLYKANRTPAEISRQRQMWESRLRFVGELFRADVPVLAGTDTGTPYAVPGFALHEELELLVRAGGTPLQALRAATLEPARFLGLGDDLGSVTPGTLADLVVLDSNPLSDIRNSRRIHSVVLRGRVVSPAERARMLAAVEAAAAEPPPANQTAVTGCCGTRRPGQ